MFLEKGGVGGVVWELTLVLNDLIERHQPTLVPHAKRTVGTRHYRQQFAVWVAQRGGQRSNKCSEMEVAFSW